MTDLIGRTLGSYRLVAQLGLGGMATVYKAYHPATDRYVAIKVPPRHLASDVNFRTRFKREAKTLGGLEHPHILPVYDYGEEDGLPYLVMRCVESGSLRDMLAAGPLPLDRAVRLVAEVAEALSHAHRQGVIHRDVKPANVLVDQDGTALLTDFGIAKLLEETLLLTGTGVSIGTPFYMSPEQVQGKPVDARTDIYALGVVLYEAVLGRRPFVAETPLAVALMHVNDPLRLPHLVNPAVPAGVERIILRAMAKDPIDRFQSAADFAAALRGTPTGRVRPKAADPSAKVMASPGNDAIVGAQAPGTLRRPPVALVAVGIGIVVVLLVIAAIMSRPPVVASPDPATPSAGSGTSPAIVVSPSVQSSSTAALISASNTSAAANPSSTVTVTSPTLIVSMSATPTVIAQSPTAIPPSPTDVVEVPGPGSVPLSPTPKPFTTPTPVARTPTPIPRSPTPIPPSPTAIPPTEVPPTTMPPPKSAAPVLLGANNSGGSVVLSWSYAGQLDPSDFFDVRVWQDGQPANGIANIKQTNYAIGGNYPAGSYNWTIAVIRKQGNGIMTLSQASQTLRFLWAPAGGRTNPYPAPYPAP